jgi:phosphoglycerate dehydrogenase-like enzyme
MIRVGVLDWVDQKLLAAFPAETEVEIVRYDTRSSEPIEVDFLVVPFARAEAEHVIPRVQGVRVLQSVSAGVEWLVPLVPKGAVLANAQGVHNASTAEWAVAAILASLKYFPFYRDQQQLGQWVADARVTEMYKAIHHDEAHYAIPVLIEELYGKQVLIVGYGAIGKAIEERLSGFGVEIVRVARTAREGVSAVADLPALLPAADIIVLITPLTDQTRHLIDAAAIARMKQGALVVNAARGGVIDTDALVAALEAGKIRAALDVTDPEPLPPGHPLWSAPNLLLTPHVAGSSPIFMRRVYDFVAAQLGRYVRGEPLENVIEGQY